MRHNPAKIKAMKLRSAILFTTVFSLAGCASTNSYLADRQTTVEMYHIFDIKTKADIATVAKAATDGLSQNTGEVTSNMPLQLGKVVPAEPGRFSIEDMSTNLGGTGMGKLMQIAAMQNGGIGLKTANCNGAVWTSRAQRNIAGSSNLTLHSCLYRYKDGYHINTYAVFQKREGGFYQVSREIANSIVGTPEEWVNKTIVDMVRTIEAKATAKISYVEGQPAIGNLPWVDRVDSNIKSNKVN